MHHAKFEVCLLIEQCPCQLSESDELPKYLSVLPRHSFHDLCERLFNKVAGLNLSALLESPELAFVVLGELLPLLR